MDWKPAVFETLGLRWTKLAYPTPLKLFFALCLFTLKLFGSFASHPSVLAEYYIHKFWWLLAHHLRGFSLLGKCFLFLILLILWARSNRWGCFPRAHNIYHRDLALGDGVAGVPFLIPVSKRHISLCASCCRLPLPPIHLRCRLKARKVRLWFGVVFRCVWIRNQESGMWIRENILPFFFLDRPYELGQGWPKMNRIQVMLQNTG